MVDGPIDVRTWIGRLRTPEYGKHGMFLEIILSNGAFGDTAASGPRIGEVTEERGWCDRWAIEHIIGLATCFY